MVREQLIQALKNPLPGIEAHRRMKPVGRDERMMGLDDENQEIRSAVLVLLSSHDLRPRFHVLLTLRSSTLRSHTGQISFPGGRIEPGETPEQAALRECEEETGIPANLPEILGRLSPISSPASIGAVLPIVAWLGQETPIRIQTNEVDEAFWQPIDDLGEPVLAEWELSGGKRIVPHWPIHRVPLWGLTACVMEELKEILNLKL